MKKNTLIREVKKRKKTMVFPFCCLAVFGCGKKIENTKTNTELNYNSALEANVIDVKLNFNQDGQTTSKQYKFDENAWVKIPRAVYVQAGSPIDYKTKLYFNANANEFEFFCEYGAQKQLPKADSLDGYAHDFLGCFGHINESDHLVEFNYSPGTDVAQDRGNSIYLNLSSQTTEEDTQVFTEVEVDWL
jgi:hypothetical protein